ncbi:hypothetical protein Tco_1233179, partial [Tanacetum coccineum]
AFGSPNTTPLATRINDLKRKMLDGKLVLVDDDGKPLKKVDHLVNADSDNKVDEVRTKGGRRTEKNEVREEDKEKSV